MSPEQAAVIFEWAVLGGVWWVIGWVLWRWLRRD